MLDPKKLEEIAKNISDAIPAGVKSMAGEAEGKVKQVIQSQLTKLDLVTREEFDVQSQVLIRTREKLEAMEARIAALELRPYRPSLKHFSHYSIKPKSTPTAILIPTQWLCKKAAKHASLWRVFISVNWYINSIAAHIKAK
jgi:BMFP domain-containing protein YqiC